MRERANKVLGGRYRRLWARLVLHFWATAMSEDARRTRGPDEAAYIPDPIAYLQRAYELTKEATSGPDWQGTTTATGAQLFYKSLGEESGSGKDSASDAAKNKEGGAAPVLYVTNLGDSQVMVVRPNSGATGELIFKTEEQWHWFDCPRQLGTNSPDTPTENAVMETVPIQEGDVVLAMSDGVIDNLWSHEIVENVSTSLKKWEAGEARAGSRAKENGAMAYVADELMLAAKTIALDPFAESPFMEHAIEEGLPSEGGELAWGGLVSVHPVVVLMCLLQGSWMISASSQRGVCEITSDDRHVWLEHWCFQGAQSRDSPRSAPPKHTY